MLYEILDLEGLMKTFCVIVVAGPWYVSKYYSCTY